MASGRMLPRATVEDPRMGQLSPKAFALFLACVPFGDVDGRIGGDTVWIRGNPLRRRSDFTDVDVDECVAEWERTTTLGEDGVERVDPLAHRYHASGMWVIEFVGWQLMQKGLRRDREAPSAYPEFVESAAHDPALVPPGGQMTLAGVAPDQLRSNSGVTPAEVQSEGEGERKEGANAPSGAVSSPPSSSSHGGAPVPAPPHTEPVSVRAEAAGPDHEEPRADELAQHRAIRDVYDHWREARQRTRPVYDRMTDQRRDKIKARLTRYTATDLKRAIDAVALDPWPDRERHDDLVQIFRSDETVDRFLDLAEKEVTGGKYAKYNIGG